jgi:hypothetical protein
MKFPGRSHNEMELFRADEVERIYRVTDALDLHRDWVVVPLNAAGEGMEVVQPDGKILIRAPGGPKFEPWLAGLCGRLEQLDLGRTPRRSENDPKFTLTGPGEPRAVGTRPYAGPLGILRQ